MPNSVTHGSQRLQGQRCVHVGVTTAIDYAAVLELQRVEVTQLDKGGVGAPRSKGDAERHQVYRRCPTLEVDVAVREMNRGAYGKIATIT